MTHGGAWAVRVREIANEKEQGQQALLFPSIVLHGLSGWHMITPESYSNSKSWIFFPRNGRRNLRERTDSEAEPKVRLQPLPK